MPRRPPQRRDFGHIRKLPSGRYQASFTGPDLLRHNAPVTFEAKDLAIMWLLNEKKQIDDAATAVGPPAGCRWEGSVLPDAKWDA